MNLDHFKEELNSYLGHIYEAKAKKLHHDYRRALFMDFISKSFDVPCVEVELEKNVKGSSFAGFIDALYKDIVFEFKRDLVDEREKGKEELTKYLKSLHQKGSYFGVLTDGVVFETYNLKEGNLEKIDEVDISKLSDKEVFIWIDSFLFSVRDYPPTSDDIVRRFGSRSPVFVSSINILNQMYDINADDNSLKVKFTEWDRLLAKVYGSSVATKDLFIRHTYLTLLAKLIASLTLFKTKPKTQEELFNIVSGEKFHSQGFINLVEADFFSWVLIPNLSESAFSLLSGLAQHLSVYDLNKINEDLLKELYQGLVDPQTRHDLGEFYTPDWLAELTLKEAGFSETQSVLDPACGSGTFLFSGIRMLIDSGFKGSKLVDFVTNNIVGIDVHPVAVTIAKMNYVLALSSELVGYPKNIAVPIYLADSLATKLAVTLMGERIAVEVTEKEGFDIPIESAEHPEDLDQIIDEMRLYAEKPKEAFKGFEAYLQSRGLGKFALYWMQNLELMRKLVNEERDTIWSYILKNFSRPLFFSKQNFDLIAGNPPWLSYRYVRDQNYQKQIKRLVFDYKLLEKKDVKLFTHMDTSTLFYTLSADLYLRAGGKVAFVLPRSVLTGAKQHDRFKQTLSSSLGSSVYLALRNIIDLEGVNPLFNVPSCVLISEKSFDSKLKQIAQVTVSGNLETRNALWSQAEKQLSFVKGEMSIDQFASSVTKKSYYYKRFKQGATIVPRFMWLVQPAVAHGVGVINASKPALTTQAGIEIIAKDTWKGRLMSGSAESKFLFTTLLADGLIPFGCIQLNLAVLPLNTSLGKNKMTDSKETLKEGFSGASKWFADCESLWETNKKKGIQENIYEWLNYRQKMTSQHPTGFQNVLYNTSGTNLTACVVDATDLDNLKIGELVTQGFIAESVTYQLQTESYDESHYLCAVLNSSNVNKAIKPYQPRGTWGARHIHRRPFEKLPIPIPKFDPANKEHLQLAELSKDCHKKVESIKGNLTAKAIGRKRTKVRSDLQKELAKIDKIVSEILSEKSRGRLKPLSF